MWSGKISGVVNPSEVGGVPVANIHAVSGIHSDSQLLTIEIQSINEDVPGSCDYPNAGTCIATSTFSATVVNPDGPITYAWSTDVGTIVGGTTNPTANVEITSGVNTVAFSVSLTVTDNSNNDTRQQPFEQSRGEIGGEVVYVEDSFTGADGTDIVGRLPDVEDYLGGVWTNPSGNPGLVIATDQASSLPSGRPRNSHDIVLPTADFVASVDCLELGTNANAFYSLHGRNTETGNNASWNARLLISSGATTGAFQLREVTSTRDNVDMPATIGESGTLTMTFNGQTITVDAVFPSDTQQITYGSALVNEMVANVGMGGDRGVLLDNFKVTAVP